MRLAILTLACVAVGLAVAAAGYKSAGTYALLLVWGLQGASVTVPSRALYRLPVNLVCFVSMIGFTRFLVGPCEDCGGGVLIFLIVSFFILLAGLVGELVRGVRSGTAGGGAAPRDPLERRKARWGAAALASLLVGITVVNASPIAGAMLVLLAAVCCALWRGWGIADPASDAHARAVPIARPASPEPESATCPTCGMPLPHGGVCAACAALPACGACGHARAAHTRGSCSAAQPVPSGLVAICGCPAYVQG